MVDPVRRELKLPRWLTATVFAVADWWALKANRQFAYIVLAVVIGSNAMWAYDAVRYSELAKTCARLPVGQEYAPLKRVVFASGCNVQSACDPDHFLTTQVLSHYEVVTYADCGYQAAKRPDQHLVGWIAKVYEATSVGTDWIVPPEQVEPVDAGFSPSLKPDSIGERQVAGL